MAPTTSNDQVSFSYPGVPATTGMSDCYTNGRSTDTQAEQCNAGACPPLRGVGRRNFLTTPQPKRDNPRGVIIGVQMFVTSNASLYRRGRPQIQTLKLQNKTPRGGAGRNAASIRAASLYRTGQDRKQNIEFAKQTHVGQSRPHRRIDPGRRPHSCPR